MNTDVKKLLEGVKNGSVSVDEALLTLKKEPFEDIGYAKIDMHRQVRQGAAEVIYGASKSADQILGIVSAMLDKGQKRILITRLADEKAEALKEINDFEYYPGAKVGIVGGKPEATGIGKIVVATGGTSDVPVAEEAALTAECFGNEVVRLYDVGVAGLHRLLSHMDELMDASVIIAAAGMEGAAPLRVTEIAAAAAARRRASGRDISRSSAAAKYPVKVSPAPVVSTAST